MISYISLLLEVFPLKQRLYFSLFLILNIASITKFHLSPLLPVPYSIVHLPRFMPTQFFFRKKRGLETQEKKKIPMHRQKSLRHPQSHCQESYKNIKLHNCKVYAEDLAQAHKRSVFVSSVSVSPMNPDQLNPCAVFLWCPLLFQHLQPFLPLFCGFLLALHSVWL